jgi:Secretion system C-terminal sorting domain
LTDVAASYPIHYRKVYQFDLKADTVSTSKTLIAVYDGFKKPYATRFYLAQLAINGKIYIATTNSSKILHVINKPNEKGLACDLVQHGVDLPTLNFVSIPNLPNFELGKLEGVVCDSIVTELDVSPRASERYKLYPNPSDGNFSISTPNSIKGAIFYLYDLWGQLVFQQKLEENQTGVEIESLPPSTYFYYIKKDKKTIQQGKIVLIN